MGGQIKITNYYAPLSQEEARMEAQDAFDKIKVGDLQRAGDQAVSTTFSTESPPIERRSTSHQKHQKRRAQGRRPPERAIRCLTLLTQNVRGLAKTEKNIQTWLASFRRKRKERQVDVVFLQETRAHKIWARKLTEAHARSWGDEPSRRPAPMSFWQNPLRPSGGVAILLHPHSAITNVRPKWEAAWCSNFMAVEGEYEGSSITLVNIYGSSSSKQERDLLFQRIENLGRPEGLVVMGGDFNCVLDRELDRSRTAGAPDTGQLQSLLDAWRLADATTEYQLAISSEADKRRFHAEHHTYRYRSGATGIASSRLDRVYVSTHCLNRLHSLQVSTPLNHSDHNAVWMTLTEPTPPPPSKTKAGRRCLRYPLPPESLELVGRIAAEHLGRYNGRLSSMTVEDSAREWDSSKTVIRTCTLTGLRELRKKIVRAYRQRRHRLKAQLRSAEADIGRVFPTVSSITEAMAALTIDRQARWQRIRDELIGQAEGRALRQRQRTYATHAGTGSDATRAFLRRIQTKFQRRPQARLTPVPGRSRDPARRLAEDWAEITQRGPMDARKQDAYFATLPPPRALVMAAPLLLPFTEAEVAEAIAACPRGKASEPDGLPNDWYRDQAEQLIPTLTRLFNQWFTTGLLPPSFSGATVFCIPKKPHPATGLDYRPIALLNTDYKIFSRLLLTRIKGQLDRVVAPTQFGFVPNRQVHDALDVWAAIAHRVDAGDVPETATAILLDFAKAYDTVDRRFLSLALRRLGFPEVMIKAVEAMHLGTTAAYLAEDRISDSHAILNGIRQGCPLAPVLFILAVDTLYTQLAAASGLHGIPLSDSVTITAAGFADDTTVYMRAPHEALTLRAELDAFATVSGLGVNVDKCVAVALSKKGWASDVGDIGFPKLPRDQMARALGAQVSSALNTELVWDLTIKQLRTRLVLAQVKTTDVLQRAQVAQAIITPKLLYVGRHAWPNATRIRQLQKLTNNYVWHGRFDLDVSGRAWMNHDTATLPRKEGGIALPDLASEFLQLATSTHVRWGEHATGLRADVGRILSGGNTRSRPTRQTPGGPTLRATLAATGAAIAAALSAQPRRDDELEMGRALLQTVGRRTRETRWWRGGWLFADYADKAVPLLALRRKQRDSHGSFNFHGLMGARICGDDVLLDHAGRPVRASDFPALVRPTDRVGDILEVQWVTTGRARFRCRTIPFPLPPLAARSFRRLCDTIVYNYPAVLLPHDPSDVVRVQPATIDSWRLQRGEHAGYELVWEPTAKIRIPLGPVKTIKDVTKHVRHVLNDPTARALDHDWLCPVRTIWHPRAATLTKTLAKKHIRAAKTRRGRRETMARGRQLTEEDELIGTAQAQRPWKQIDQYQATTSSQRLGLRRLKGNRVSAWDRLHNQRGCPHCPDDPTGGSVSHIYRRCPAAAALWSVLHDGWQALGIWPAGPSGDEQRVQAAFDLQLPRFPATLWKLPDLHGIPATDAEQTEHMHSTLQTAWQQQVLVTYAAIGKWRHNIEDGEQQWTTPTAKAYLLGALRSSLRGLLDRLPRDGRLRDPRRQLLAKVAAGFNADGLTPESTDGPRHRPQRSILFFDGGSRGNPGPGGAGAVLVTMDVDATHPRVVWSACMAYQRQDTTNNQAEYLGAIAGLREAKARGLRPDVVGDSALILGQLQHYRPPRNKKLRPLYSEARRLADDVQVDVWQHHLRAYNKMADAAANVAMDTCASVQVSHPSDRPHTATIDGLLLSDFHEWHTRHILRTAQD